jgi:hypothetical protein
VSSGRSAAMKWLASIDVTAKVGCPGAPDLRHVVVEPGQAAAPGPHDLHPQRRSGARPADAAVHGPRGLAARNGDAHGSCNRTTAIVVSPFRALKYDGALPP